tara:strand:+ start:1688 stop:2368 length:681 start_codon:yes stop_codon:yes gene_type:complete
MLKTFGFIFARGGSKGIPMKNLVEISGLPLLAHAINLSKSMKEVEKTFVSTDSEEIADAAKRYGAFVIERPSELATDNAAEWLAWQHAINYVRKTDGDFQRFLSLPTTSPMRSKGDVQKCLKALVKDIDLVLTITPAQRNPWFNIVTSDKESMVKLVLEDSLIKRRQDAPSCYDMTTVAYVARPDFILNNTNMWQGRVKGVEIPVERAIDIDTPFDLSIARFLMKD